jgi:hypothetical protein|tara:strand:+ start:1618 stop:1800 length:183 start_codon:yes stop_codon:yes gene_type:complete
MIGIYNISEDLITWLEDTFPNKLPSDRVISIEEIRFLQGQQNIIEIIKATYNESVDDVYA